MNTNPGLIAKKLGHTQTFLEDGEVRRVTAVSAGPCVVLGIRTKEKHGYSAVQMGFGTKKLKQVNKPLAGQYAKINQAPAATVKEFRLPEDVVSTFEIGQTVKVSDVFKPGQFVDVTGTSKGKGFAGVMKRHNFSGAGTVGHGTHEYKRHGGSIGMNMTPGRVFKGKKMPGQHGSRRTTVMNLKIVKVLDEEGILLLDGGVPGHAGSTLTVRIATKKKQPVEA